MSFLSFLIVILEKTSFLFEELFFTSFTIFFTEFKEIMPLVISFVPARIMMQSGSTGKIFNRWSLDSPFSLIPLRSDTPATTTFFLFNLIVCASSLGTSDSILSLRGLLFALLLSGLWFCQGL